MRSPIGSLHRRLLRFVLQAAICGAALAAPAQQRPAPAPLPNAPSQQVTGSISGFVTDVDGDAVPGAHVTLGGDAATRDRSTVTDPSGRFVFSGVAPANFKLSVMAPGFGSITRSILLLPGDQMETATIALAPSTTLDVEVSSESQEEIAEEQLHIEYKQRVLGVIPNFYATYDWNAAPLNPRQKFELAWRSIVDPTTFVFNGITAGIEQADNAFSGYRQGASGYGKRYGAGMADLTVGTLAGGAVYPILFRQDPRYFYMGPTRGSITHRALYAMSTAVITRGDNGKWQPNYSSVAGDITAGAVSNLYYPSTDTSDVKTTIENGLLNAAFDGIGNLFQEFVVRRLTPHLPEHPTTDPDTTTR